MTNTTTTQPPTRNTGVRRVLTILAVTVLAWLAVVLLVVGAVATISAVSDSDGTQPKLEQHNTVQELQALGLWD